MTVLRCMDCGIAYADFPLDTYLPDEQWRRLVPESDGGGGVLCASCIVARAARVPGVTVVYLSIYMPRESTCVSDAEQSWQGALAFAQAELHRVDKLRRRLMFATRTIRRLIKDGRPWPTVNEPPRAEAATGKQVP